MKSLVLLFVLLTGCVLATNPQPKVELCKQCMMYELDIVALQQQNEHLKRVIHVIQVIRQNEINALKQRINALEQDIEFYKKHSDTLNTIVPVTEPASKDLP